MTPATHATPDADLIRPAIFADVPGLVAGFTTRAFSGTDAGAVDKARGRLGVRCGFNDVASVGQVHGNAVAVVREGGHVPGHDAVVTERRGLLLTTVAADCALVLLADAEAGVVGVAHSGWRGTVAGIAADTVAAMRGLGADPKRMRAYVAPCISVAAFEVGEEVAAHFDPAHVARRAEWPRPHVDLRTAIADTLRRAGLSDAHVELSDACTASDLGRFHSYRAEGGTAGRMLGFVGLRA